MFAYCGNNPVMFVDPEGKVPKWLKSIGDAFANAFNAVFSSVEADVAFGTGLGIDILDTISLGAYHETYVGIDDGVGVTGKRAVLEASLFGTLGVNKNYDLLIEKDLQRKAMLGPDDGVMDMIDHPNTEQKNQRSILIFSKTDSGDFLIATSASLYVGIGASASASFNVSEFFRRLFD